MEQVLPMYPMNKCPCNEYPMLELKQTRRNERFWAWLQYVALWDSAAFFYVADASCNLDPDCIAHSQPVLLNMLCANSPKHTLNKDMCNHLDSNPGLPHGKPNNYLSFKGEPPLLGGACSVVPTCITPMHVAFVRLHFQFNSIQLKGALFAGGKHMLTVPKQVSKYKKKIVEKG